MSCTELPSPVGTDRQTVGDRLGEGLGDEEKRDESLLLSSSCKVGGVFSVDEDSNEETVEKGWACNDEKGWACNDGGRC